MGKKKKSGWQLDWADVSSGRTDHTSTTRKKLRYSRALDERSRKCTLTHEPTGIKAVGTIPTGHYSKKHIQKLCDELFAKLFTELEAKVARALRVPGRAGRA